MAPVAAYPLDTNMVQVTEQTPGTHTVLKSNMSHKQQLRTGCCRARDSNMAVGSPPRLPWVAIRQPTSACSSYPQFFRSVSFHSKQIITLFSLQFLSLYFLTIMAATMKALCGLEWTYGGLQPDQNLRTQIGPWVSFTCISQVVPDGFIDAFNQQRLWGPRLAHGCLSHTWTKGKQESLFKSQRVWKTTGKNETSLNQLEQSLHELKDAKEASTGLT